MMKKILRQNYKFTGLFIVSASFFIVFFLFSGNQKAFAANTCNPVDNAGVTQNISTAAPWPNTYCNFSQLGYTLYNFSIPDPYLNYLDDCQPTSDPILTSWISNQSNSLNLSSTAASGIINLQINEAASSCTGTNSDGINNQIINSCVSTTGGLPGFPSAAQCNGGTISSLPASYLVNHPNCGCGVAHYFQAGQLGFTGAAVTFNVSGLDMTKPGWHTSYVYIEKKGIQQFHGNAWLCTTNGKSVGSYTDFSNPACTSSVIKYPITYYVPAPMVVNFDNTSLSCTTKQATVSMSQSGTPSYNIAYAIDPPNPASPPWITNDGTAVPPGQVVYANAAGDASYTFDLSATNQLIGHDVYIIVASNSPTNPSFIVKTAHIGACYTVSCGTSPVVTAIISNSQSISASVNFTSIAGAPSGPPFIGTSKVYYIVISQGLTTISPTSGPTQTSPGTSTATFNTTSLKPGSFNVNWKFGPDQPVSCSSTSPSTALSAPYLSVTGGDVVAGSNINVTSNCSTTIASGILSWNNNTLGSGTTMAAQALAAIYGFASDQGSGNLYNYLSFANSNTPSIDGQFGDSPCTPTFATQTSFTAYTGALTSVSPGMNAYNQSIVIRNLTNFTGQSTIYVNGNVSIKGDIKYDTAGPWSISGSTNSIPSLKIIATGDIVIDPDVTQLDGVYETTQYIYDCSTHASGPNIGKYQNTSPRMNPCYTNSLTVNGSFIANRIFFQRTGGNAYTSGSPAAETFNYGPEDWLSSPDSSTGREDSLKSLPPVF